MTKPKQNKVSKDEKKSFGIGTDFANALKVIGKARPKQNPMHSISITDFEEHTLPTGNAKTILLKSLEIVKVFQYSLIVTIKNTKTSDSIIREYKTNYSPHSNNDSIASILDSQTIPISEKTEINIQLNGVNKALPIKATLYYILNH